ncbi:MAG: FAD-dependent monooxygenase [Pseudomonadota bacterium]
MERQDVIIAGGGIIGTLLGLALARSGLTATVCDALPEEARRADDFDGRAYAVAAAGRRMLDALGLWPALAADAQPMSRIEIADPGSGDRMAGAAALPTLLQFDHRQTDGGPFAHMIEDRHLRRAVQDAAATTPGLSLRAPISVAGHQAGPGGVTVHLDDGTALAGGVLAACDGRASATARHAGLTSLGWDYGQNGLVCALETAHPHHGVAREIFLPAGPFAVLPLTGNRVSLVWTESRARARAIDALDDDAYLAELSRRMGTALGPARLIGKRYTYPLALALAQRWVAPRIALVGDSAHAIHPLAGQGLNLGLADVAALTEVLVTARRRGEDPGALDVLSRYQVWRRFDAAAMALTCDAFNRLFSNDAPVLRGLRGLGLSLVNRLPAARRAFMAAASGEAGSAPRLMQGQPL